MTQVFTTVNTGGNCYLATPGGVGVLRFARALWFLGIQKAAPSLPTRLVTASHLTTVHDTGRRSGCSPALPYPPPVQYYSNIHDNHMSSTFFIFPNFFHFCTKMGLLWVVLEWFGIALGCFWHRFGLNPWGNPRPLFSLSSPARQKLNRLHALADYAAL